MGQRHQIFVKIANPVKHMENAENSAVKKKLVKEFGTGEFAILAYHNQWLYGRSALQNCLNLLNFAKQFTREEKTTRVGGFKSPICPSAMKYEMADDEAKTITSHIATVMNFNPVKKDWCGAGFGSSFYIGNEDTINFDYTRGDNNDGIHIVDMVENKYCFMNIYDQEKEMRNSASDLPSCTPVDAGMYVRAYYGETLKTINEYHIKDAKSAQEISDKLEDHKKTNAEVLEGFKEFAVLTPAEVKKMFSKMNKKKTA